MVIIHRGEDISQYGRGRFGRERKTCLQRQNDFFDESMSEYKYILRYSCQEHLVNLLNFIADDLNKISSDSYVHRMTRKY